MLISPNEVVDKCVYIVMEIYYDVVFTRAMLKHSKASERM